MPKTKILKVFEGFSGYGGGSFALKKLSEKYPDFEFDVVGCSEIDKYADALYAANHKNRK